MGKGGGISVAKNDLGSAKNRVVGCQKFSFWQNGVIFGNLGKFLADYSCKIAGKPMKWAFVGGLGKCQKYSFWQ